MTKHAADYTRTLRLLFWESTARCNLSCIHCRRLDAEQTADLTTLQAKEMMDQLAALGQAQAFMPLLVFSGGEPLCREDLFELLEYAAAKGIHRALATNGTLIDAAAARKIKSAGVQRVSVSLDGADARIHNKLRRQDGSFEAAVCGIRHLRHNDVPFQINMTLTRHNAGHLDAVLELACALGAAAVHVFGLVPVGCGQQLDCEQMLSAEEYEQLLRHIARKEETAGIELKVTCVPHYQRVIRQEKPQPRRMSKGCLAGSGVLFVSHKGEVFPCGYLPVFCGSILHGTLTDIWHSSPDLARMQDAGQLKGKCGVCCFKTVCGGCRARAFAATGDYMEAEPMCIYQPPRKDSHD
ncbi:MAG: radical SAM protein [Phycisphaerae bacterium]|nr:radical SAM protein [Phycisphaerae bacterium]